jgi:hypothetical protein
MKALLGIIRVEATFKIFNQAPTRFPTKNPKVKYTLSTLLWQKINAGFRWQYLSNFLEDLPIFLCHDENRIVIGFSFRRKTAFTLNEADNPIFVYDSYLPSFA